MEHETIVGPERADPSRSLHGVMEQWLAWKRHKLQLLRMAQQFPVGSKERRDMVAMAKDGIRYTEQPSGRPASATTATRRFTDDDFYKARLRIVQATL